MLKQRSILAVYAGGLLLLFMCYGMTAVAQPAPAQDDSERVIWNKTPIPILLVVGQERRIYFPGSVSLGMPEGMTSRLRSQSIEGTVYWMAFQPFGVTRVVARLQEGGPLIVIDLTAVRESQVSPPTQLHITVPELERKTASGTKSDPAESLGLFESQSWGYAALTRHAAHQMYAPARLLRVPVGVVRVSVPTDPIPLVQGQPVDAYPVAAWRVGLRTVTAIKLVNRGEVAVVLDPRHLRGTWLAATFQHNRLLPAGDEADTTAVYLISARPFEFAF